MKIAVYSNYGGERSARFIENIGSTVFRGVPRVELKRFNDRLLGRSEKRYLEEFAAAGLSFDSVF